MRTYYGPDTWIGLLSYIFFILQMKKKELLEMNIPRPHNKYMAGEEF